MTTSQTQREALQRACITRPYESMTTVLNTLFSSKLTTPRQSPFIESATKIFLEHWACAAREEILDPAHNSLELLTRACAKWQADLCLAEALSSHTAKLQAQVATM